MTQPIEQIAAIFAQQLWHHSGRTLGHLGLLYTADKAIDKLEGKQSGFLSWINPFPKLKKAGTWLGLEGAAHAVPQISQTWDKGAPIAEKFFTPIIESMIRTPLQFLADNGFITINNPTSSSWTNYLNPVTLTRTLISNTTDLITSPFHAIFNGSEPVTPIHPAYQWADTNAPQIGRFIANGIESSFDYTGKMIQFPGNVIQAISNATGLPYPVVLAGTIGISLMAYQSLRGWTTSVTTVQSVKIGDMNNKAEANMGGVHIHLAPQYDAAKQKKDDAITPQVPVVFIQPPVEGKKTLTSPSQ
ncbi:MAG: hypothetical protein BGO43_12485 [Gammaproteobacteria bacterium 39-13]|nr:hypothetical protein [Gammaproteobacteria bacterium]OJV89965.1 MAG: hypothetical protein BGO43_12485 [Gammaproteobacteria bacterium 39-13]